VVRATRVGWRASTHAAGDAGAASDGVASAARNRAAERGARAIRADVFDGDSRAGGDHDAGLEQGLRIDIDAKRVARASDSPWRETMSVYVTARGEFVVNGAPVAKRELKNRVAAELNQRASWLVYVEADDGVEFSEVTYAIDTIEGLGAQVFWITPAVRNEWDAARARR
jgi:hypothetical protein